MPTWVTVSRRELAFQELLAWLEDHSLTVDAGSLEVTTPPSGILTDLPELVGVPTGRGTQVEPCDESKLKQVRHQWADRGVALNDATQREAVWQELRDLSATIRRIEPARVPADAIAFYRGFHITPVNQWGIYIVVPRLLA